MFIPNKPIKFYYIQSNLVACVIQFFKNLYAIWCERRIHTDFIWKTPTIIL